MGTAAILAAIASGGLVGFALGLVGGGGSILAVPLLVYVVGISNPHVAIGTGAVAVAANALSNLIGRARSGLVKWPCAITFAAFGVAGAFAGAYAGKRVDGDALLALFAILMVVVAVLMLKRRHVEGEMSVRLGRENFLKLALYGLGAGLLSGFFGIGGGFLIVPGLMAATGMPIVNAMASSLFAVSAFGVSTASSYAFSGLVDWGIAGLFILGGIAGGIGGSRLSQRISGSRGALNILFATLILAVAAYMLFESAQQLIG